MGSLVADSLEPEGQDNRNVKHNITILHDLQPSLALPTDD
jgi:hypothetical protein